MDITTLTGAFAARGADGPQQRSSETGDIFSSDGFLSLLAAQIRNQNPLEPMKDTEFIAQMAQFSQLEQTTNLARDIRGLTMGQQLSQGAALIGRTVTYEDAEGVASTGVVERLSVSADGREMMLRVDGAIIEVGQVVTVDS
ncbi:MAG: flagellar hook capping FlgD N-terminal domain-containing protein [Miltoncostaeaceae bacterium]